MSGERRGRSRPRFAARYLRVTDVARFPAAAHAGAMRTISNTGPTVARPRSITWLCCVDVTTAHSTKADSQSRGNPTDRSSSSVLTGSGSRRRRPCRSGIVREISMRRTSRHRPWHAHSIRRALGSRLPASPSPQARSRSGTARRSMWRGRWTSSEGGRVLRETTLHNSQRTGPHTWHPTRRL